MLLVESERIRGVVLFDARYSRDPWVCAQLRILEAYSSKLIADVSISMVDFLDTAMREAAVPQSNSRGHVNNRLRLRLSLADHLARAHKRGLKKQSVASPAGLVAREGVHYVMNDLGLITSTCVPLSVVLRRTVRRYEAVAHDHDALSELLTKSVDTALEWADSFASEIEALQLRWRGLISPRPDTVLAIAVDHVGRHASLRSGPLVEQTAANKSNVYRAIDQLESVGIIREVTGRKKDQMWVSPDLVDLIQATVGTATGPVPRRQNHGDSPR